jgi:N6-adenosine-specific RNA methylase IME4
MDYQVILADPAWKNRWGDMPGEITTNNTRAPGSHYPVMDKESICALSVADITAPDAVLLLWACWPLLPDALEVIGAWGFEYKSLAWVWVKQNRGGLGLFTGMGYWTRANTEPCLLATRGAGLPRLARDVLAIILSPVREHSRKPDEQYGKIERLFGDVPRIELFARQQWPGWDVWGNEVDSTVSLEG